MRRLFSLVISVLFITLSVESLPTAPLSAQTKKLADISADAIEEVSIESPPCEGDFCLVYKAVFRRDGTALHSRKKNVKMLGEYKGEISKAVFDELAKFIAARNYSKIKISAGRAVESLMREGRGLMLITRIKANGETKTFKRPVVKIENPYNLSDVYIRVPRELLEIEAEIQRTVRHTKWQLVK